MVLSSKEVLQEYKTRYNLLKAIKKKKLFKLEHGIYSDKEVVDPMVIISKKYPNAVVTMDSAFYYYDLTDVIPQKTYLATNRNSNTIKDDKIEQIWVSKEKLDQGIDVVEIDGAGVKIYNLERLLVELIRKRNQMSFDYYKEIIKNYREIADNLDMYKIEEYLKLYKNEESLYEALMREVF